MRVRPIVLPKVSEPTMPDARLIGMNMNEHSGDIAAAVMIGAAIILALMLLANADELSAQPSQIITSTMR